MNSINVFVTGVGGGGHGEQILKALKIAKTNYTIIGGEKTELLADESGDIDEVDNEA